MKEKAHQNRDFWLSAVPLLLFSIYLYHLYTFVRADFYLYDSHVSFCCASTPFSACLSQVLSHKFLAKCAHPTAIRPWCIEIWLTHTACVSWLWESQLLTVWPMLDNYRVIPWLKLWWLDRVHLIASCSFSASWPALIALPTFQFLLVLSEKVQTGCHH